MINPYVKTADVVTTFGINDVVTTRPKSARFLGRALPNDDPVGRFPTSLYLPRLSRYRSTLVYPTLNQSFGRWALTKNSLPPDSSDEYHIVQNNEIYRLDIISYNQYSTALLWWVIALVNGIQNTFVKPDVNDLLRVPNLDRVLSVLT